MSLHLEPVSLGVHRYRVTLNPEPNDIDPNAILSSEYVTADLVEAISGALVFFREAQPIRGFAPGAWHSFTLEDPPAAGETFDPFREATVAAVCG